MRLPATILAAALTVGAVACTLTTDLDGLSGGAAPSDDDGASGSGPGGTTSSGTSGTSTSSASSGVRADAGGSSTTSTSGATSSTTSSTGGPEPSAVVLVDERFPRTCDGWSGVNVSVATHRPDTGAGAAGACMVCGSNAGDFFITKTVTAPRAGRVGAQMQVKQNDAGPTATSATLAIQIGGSASSSTKNIGTSFALFTGGSASVASGTSLMIKVGLMGASPGQCLIVDDIVATLN